jgi:hypothetical protein
MASYYNQTQPFWGGESAKDVYNRTKSFWKDKGNWAQLALRMLCMSVIVFAILFMYISCCVNWRSWSTFFGAFLLIAGFFGLVLLV